VYQRADWLFDRSRGMVTCVPTILVLCLTSLLAVPRLSAQARSGVNGTVTDSSGATVPSATVTITEAATGKVTHLMTSSAGTYISTSLNPGRYSIAVEATGFKKAVQDNVTVEVAVQSTIDFTLNAGAATETVEVTSDAIALNTSAPELGTTLSPDVLNALPLEISGYARQIDQFVFLAPGVQGSTFGKNINGGVNFESEVVFNGVPVPQPETEGYQTNFNPPFELVNEFRVERSTFSAQYGLAQGAVTYNMSSGTNQLHADAFEILRNSLFDSDGFFPTNFSADGDPAPPVDHENNYGFTIGGPVVLPHLYNGRGRTFFHGSAEWFKQNTAETGIGTVPTAAMKAGDFSNFVDAAGNVIPIYDPATGQPFPGNKIPQSRFSPLAVGILPLIPAPDRAGTNFGLQSNKSPAVTSLPIIQHLWGFTVDHNLNQKQSLHYTEWRDTRDTAGFDYNPIVPATNELQSLKTLPYVGTGFLFNYVNSVTTNLVATAGFGWFGEINNQFDALKDVNFAGVQDSTIFPNVVFDGQNAPTAWGTEGGWVQSVNRKLGIAIVNNWLWTKGRETFNIGGEFRRAYQDDNECQTCGGQFNFSQRSTSTPDPTDPNFGTYGSAFASFLLGVVDNGNRQFANELELRNLDLSPYVQDDIKLNQRLTLNLGLRWDIQVPFTENNNNIVFLNQTTLDPGAGNLPGAATKFGNCTGCAGYTRADIHWSHLGPRAGFSYMLNNKTVLQAGLVVAFLDGGAYEYGTSKVAVSYGNLLLGSFKRISTNTSTPGYGDWDTSQMPAPPAQPFGPSIGNGQTIHYFQRNIATPYSQTWNVSVQRELPWNMFMNVAYVGGRDIHLPSYMNPINQPNPSILQYGSLLGQPANSTAAQAAGIKIPYPDFVSQFGGGATVIQALDPFPQYAGVTNNFDMAGTTYYKALQIQGEKRLTNGLSFLATLTLSRNMSNVDTGFSSFAYVPLNKYNQRPEWAVSGLDQKYLSTYVATYELPIGPGKPLLNNRGVAGRLIGGWQVSSILSYGGGSPMSQQNNQNDTNGIINNSESPLQEGYNRPNVVSGVKLQTFSYNKAKEYFTGKLGTPPLIIPTNAFTDAGPYALGNGSRNYAALRNPPYRMENFDAMKSFGITERLKATIRVDYFNAFNRTQLQNPDGVINHSTFGTVNSAGINSNFAPANRQGQASFRIEF
jgi:hypothetical protein